jgi:hypothetical protein
MASRSRTTFLIKAFVVSGFFVALLVFLVVRGWVGEADGDDRPADSFSPPEQVAAVDRLVDEGPESAPERVPSTEETRFFIRVVRWPDGEAVPGATIRVMSDGQTLARQAWPSINGSMDVKVPEAVELLRIVASAPDHTTAEVFVELGMERVSLELRPTRGWFGRVVTPDGSPAVGVQVVARRYWPPRPAYLDSGEERVSITSVQAVAPAFTGGATNATGHYYVEAFEEENVVDLVLSVASETVASDRMHVPMPHIGQQLPELVVRWAAPLTGQVVDSAGYPVAGAEVQVDRGPGLDRYIEETALTDENGRFVVGRLLSPQHLRVEEGRGWFLGGSTQGMELPMREGWVRVEPETSWVSLVLDPGGAVSGSLLDAATSRPVRDGIARLDDQDGATLVAAPTNAEGEFELLMPPERIGERVTLKLSAPGYETWNRSTIVEPLNRVHALPEFLSPGGGTELVRGQVRRLEALPEFVGSEEEKSSEMSERPAEGVVVRAYLSTRGGAVGDWVIADELPPDFELFWEGVTDTHGAFEFMVTAHLEDRLVVVSELAVPDGALHLGQWGPQTVAVAKNGIRFLQSYGKSIQVEIGGLHPNHRYFLQQTSWNPWTESSWWGAVQLPAGSEGWESLSVQSATRGAAFFDVRVDRGPVSAPVASSAGWLDLSQAEPVRLEIPELRTVAGEIPSYTKSDWPDLCLAFLGAPVPEWRSEWLGESDWSVRPSQDGAFWLEGLPPGDYTLMLYRPVGIEGVEVLAEQSISVTSDLPQMVLWPRRPDAKTAFYVLEQ